MSTTETLSKAKSTVTNYETKNIGKLFGEIISFNTTLKLHHWHVTGVGSYSKHIALDEAIGGLLDVTDRLIETSYALSGDINIVVPETKNSTDILKDCSDFFDVVADGRKLFPEAFTQAIIDDYQEAIMQLIYRLRRLQ